MRFKTILIVASFIAFVLSGCSTLNYPSQMTEIEAYDIVSKIKKEYPKEKIYRQYVRNNIYIQFERMDDSNVIYGWYTCTNCRWTRSKMLAVYDGSYLYMIYGHHEDFFLETPTTSRLHPTKSYWSWGVINKYQIEGRNLVMLGQYRKCIYTNPTIKEWSNAPYKTSDEIFCNIKGKSYSRVFVATTDDILAGKKDSIVGTKKDSLKEKLETLKQLLDEGIIDQKSFDDQKSRLLNSL